MDPSTSDLTRSLCQVKKPTDLSLNHTICPRITHCLYSLLPNTSFKFARSSPVEIVFKTTAGLLTPSDGTAVSLWGQSPQRMHTVLITGFHIRKTREKVRQPQQAKGLCKLSASPSTISTLISSLPINSQIPVFVLLRSTTKYWKSGLVAYASNPIVQ